MKKRNIFILLFLMVILFLTSAPVWAAKSEQPLFTKILTSYLGDNNACWFCDAYSSLFTTVDNIAYNAYVPITKAIMPVFYILSAWWILWVVATLFLTGPYRNIDLFTRMFKVLLTICFGAALLHAGAKEIYELTINPLLSTTVNVGNQILDSSIGGNEINKVLIKAGERPLGCRVSPAGGRALSQETHKDFVCFLQKVSQAIIVNIAYGTTIMLTSFTIRAIDLHEVIPNFPPDIKNIFKGILIIVFSFLFFISFPFKIIDLIIRLCFLLALFPIYVFFWTFPITRQFVGSAKTMLINLMFTFIALTILTVFGLRIIVTSTMGGNFDEMLRVMLDGKLKTYLEKNAENGPGFFAIVMGLYMSTTLLDQAPALGSMIGQGTESGAIKNSVGGAAVAVTMKAASEAANKVKEHYTKDAGGGGGK